MTVLAFFPPDTQYFGPSEQRSMLNLRVDDLDAVLDKLRAGGVEIDPRREDYDYGRFAWFKDPEGNRVELWEPPASATGLKRKPVVHPVDTPPVCGLFCVRVCGFARRRMSFSRVIMGDGRVLMRLGGVLVGCLVIALAVVLRCQMMMLGGFFVVMRRLLVCFVCHFESSCGKSPGAMLRAPL